MKNKYFKYILSLLIVFILFWSTYSLKDSMALPNSSLDLCFTKQDFFIYGKQLPSSIQSTSLIGYYDCKDPFIENSRTSINVFLLEGELTGFNPLNEHGGVQINKDWGVVKTAGLTMTEVWKKIGEVILLTSEGFVRTKQGLLVFYINKVVPKSEYNEATDKSLAEEAVNYGSALDKMASHPLRFGVNGLISGLGGKEKNNFHTDFRVSTPSFEFSNDFLEAAPNNNCIPSFENLNNGNFAFIPQSLWPKTKNERMQACQCAQQNLNSPLVEVNDWRASIYSETRKLPHRMKEITYFCFCAVKNEFDKKTNQCNFKMSEL